MHGGTKDWLYFYCCHGNLNMLQKVTAKDIVNEVKTPALPCLPERVKILWN
jgi:hypothetical protein